MKIKFTPQELSAIDLQMNFQPVVEYDDAVSKEWGTQARSIIMKVAPALVELKRNDKHFSVKAEDEVEIDLDSVQAWFIRSNMPGLYQIFPGEIVGYSIRTKLYEALLVEDAGFSWVKTKVTPDSKAGDKTYKDAKAEAAQRESQKPAPPTDDELWKMM